LLQQHTH